LQDYQDSKENERVTPVTADAFNKVVKSHIQIQEQLKRLETEFNEKLDNSVNKLQEFIDKNASLVVKDDPYVFEAGDSEFKGQSTTLTEHKSQVRAVAYSKNGRLIASGSSDNTIILYDANTLKCKAVLEGHKSYVMSINFSPDGTLLVSGSYDKTLKLWNT